MPEALKKIDIQREQITHCTQVYIPFVNSHSLILDEKGKRTAVSMVSRCAAKYSNHSKDLRFRINLEKSPIPGLPSIDMCSYLHSLI